MNVKQKVNITTLCSATLTSLAISLVAAPSAHAAACSTSILTGYCGKGIWGLLGLVLQILTAGVFIVAVGGIIYGAILWTTAGDKSAQISQAKTVITNVVVGIVAYFLMYSFIQFLIPGGVFNP